MCDQNSAQPIFSKTFRNSGNGAFSRQNPYSVNLGKCAIRIRSGTCLFNTLRNSGKCLQQAKIHTAYSVTLATSALRIRFGPASPKLSGIRETGLFQGKIHTALIWENVRSEFGPAQQFLTPFLFSVHDTFAGPLHHSQPYGRFTNTPLDFLFVAQECIEARQLRPWRWENRDLDSFQDNGNRIRCNSRSSKGDTTCVEPRPSPPVFKLRFKDSFVESPGAPVNS